MDLGIEGRVALVMGASQGIGRAIATALAQEGARVALASRSSTRLEQAASQIRGETAVFEADTADLERIDRLPGEIEEALGPIDILVTNTGGPPKGAALELPLDAWRDAYTELVLAPRVLIGAVMPKMRARGWGRVVNVGSTASREPIAGLTLSSSIRPLIVSLFRTLAREVAADGVTLNDIASGRFATGRVADLGGGDLRVAERRAAKDVPAQRLGTPHEYGALVAFLCSKHAGYITGTSIPIDGGLLRSV